MSPIEIGGATGASLDLTPTVQEAQAAHIRTLLARIGKDPERFGMKEGDLLLALGTDKPWYTPFGMFTFYWGNAMKLFGTTIPTVLGITSSLYLLYKLGSKISDAISFLQKLTGAMFPWWGVASGKSGDLSSTFEGILGGGSVSGEGLNGFFVSFLPGPVGALANSTVKAIDQQISAGTISSLGEMAKAALTDMYDVHTGKKGRPDDETIVMISEITGRDTSELMKELG
jgi:hypothetical protein